METTILGFRVLTYIFRVYIGVIFPPILENQMEKKMDNEMETGIM